MLADEASKARIEQHRREANEAKQIESIKGSSDFIQLTEATKKANADSALTLDKAVEQVDALDDKSSKKDYIGTLPPQLQNDLLSYLQQRKLDQLEMKEQLEKIDQQIKINAQFDDVL